MHLGIELSKLTPVEQLSSLRKARAICVAKNINVKLGDEIAKLEMLHAGVPGLPPDIPLLVKLYDDRTNRTIMLKTTASATVDGLAELVCKALSESRLLSVYTSRTKISILTPETLLEAQSSICRGEQSCLMVLAM